MSSENVSASAEDIFFRLANSYWVSALLAAGVMNGVFNHLDRGADTAEAIAGGAGLSARGAQALLDGLVGMGLITVMGGRYANSPAASEYLVDGKPMSIAGMVRTIPGAMLLWAKLPEAVKSGAPQVQKRSETPDHPFWEDLVTAIAPTALPVVQQVAARLDMARRRPLSILDVGGGSGVYSAVLLGANPEATATQIDWANVNGVARRFVERSGVADRFHTIDGDLHSTDFGRAKYDLVIFSHVAHHDPPERNAVTLRKIRAALRPGGTLVISDFVIDDDRTGHPFALMFHTKMLLHTAGGGAWRRADYRIWLEQAGFTNVVFEPTNTPSTLIFAS